MFYRRLFTQLLLGSGFICHIIVIVVDVIVVVVVPLLLLVLLLRLLLLLLLLLLLILLLLHQAVAFSEMTKFIDCILSETVFS
jgi:hypothetical protein